MYPFYLSPTTLDDALRLKARYGERARVIAGGTDLIIELDRGVRKLADGSAPGLLDLTRIAGLGEIREEDGWIHLGALVTHNQVVGSSLIVERGFPLARACWEIGAPQIRNRATVAGNIITASPANDSIVPLMAMDATVTLASAARGERTLSLADFCTGFRRVDLAADEILVRVSFPVLRPNQEGAYVKLGLRKAQAISVLSVAVVVEWEGERASPVQRAALSLGAVAPTILRAAEAEAYLAGKWLTEDVITEAARLAGQAAKPIDDIRGSAEYRRAMVETLVARGLRQVRDGNARAGWPERPVMLWGSTGGAWPVADGGQIDREEALVNGRRERLEAGMTLLDSLRGAGYIGVKEGCAEGECGACTVFLDGIAVMACLVPAERARGSRVTTVEGLESLSDGLHPVQAAFTQSGGVQCGYCTPGFVMSAAKLLEERPQPTRSEAEQALTGNLCRCTGYRKILDAILIAGSGRQPLDLPTSSEDVD